MSILITDDATIGDLRVLVDALGDGWTLDWSDTGIELARVDDNPEVDDEPGPVHVQSATEPARPVDQAARAAHPHVCTECGTGFDKAQGLRVHVARRHGPNADVPDRPRVYQDAGAGPSSGGPLMEMPPASGIVYVVHVFTRHALRDTYSVDSVWSTWDLADRRCRWLAEREVTCHIESSTIDMPLLSLAPVEEVKP